MKVGFIGLGNLGKAIATRLICTGNTLAVWNRTPSKTEGMDVEIASSPEDLAGKADIIFICLFDSQAVKSVLTGEKGLLTGTVSGKIIVDLTTNHFREVRAFHEQCHQAGASYLESPVLGSIVPAANGALTVLVSGEQVAYEKVKPLLEQIGKHLFYLEKPTLAIKMKLINNLTLGSFMATLAEALAMGEESGLEKEKVLDILAAGGGNSMMLNAKRDKLLHEDFSAHFSSALIYKDLDCLQDLAYEMKKPLFTGAMAKELYARTFQEGIDQEDLSAVYKLFKPGKTQLPK